MDIRGHRGGQDKSCPEGPGMRLPALLATKLKRGDEEVGMG